MNNKYAYLAKYEEKEPEKEDKYAYLTKYETAPPVETAVKPTLLARRKGQTLLDVAKEKGKDVERFVKGIPEDPVGTLKGLAYGGVKALEGIVPDVFMEPEELEKESLIARKLLPKTEQEKKAAGIGRFGSNVITGMLLQTVIPSGGMIATLGKGALANLPFVLEELQTGDYKGAMVDAIANSIIDIATFGGAKYIKNVRVRNAAQDVLENGIKGADKKSIDILRKNADLVPKYIILAEDNKTILPTDEFIAKITKEAKPGEELVGGVYPQKPSRGFIKPKITDAEKILLSKKAPALNTSFNAYLDQAKAIISGGTPTSPANLMRKKAVNVLNIVEDKTKNIGEQKNEILKKYAKQTEPTTDISIKFYDLLQERTGAIIDTETGRIMSAPGRELRVVKEMPLLKQMANKINSLGPETTMQKIDDINSSLATLIRETEKEGKPVGVAKSILFEIKNLIENKMPNELKDINKKYAEQYAKRNWLKYNTEKKDIYNLLTKDRTREQSKNMINSIFKDTGIDLGLEADYALAANKAISKAFEGSGIDPTILSGFLAGGDYARIQASRGLVTKGLDRLFGSYESQLRKYYIAKQKGLVKKMPGVSSLLDEQNLKDLMSNKYQEGY